MQKPVLFHCNLASHCTDTSYLRSWPWPCFTARKITALRASGPPPRSCPASFKERLGVRGGGARVSPRCLGMQWRRRLLTLGLDLGPPASRKPGQGVFWLIQSRGSKRRPACFVFHPDTQTQDIISVSLFLRKTWWSQRKDDNKWNSPSSVTSKTGSQGLTGPNATYFIPQIAEYIHVWLSRYCVQWTHIKDTFTFPPFLSLNLPQELLVSSSTGAERCGSLPLSLGVRGWGIHYFKSPWELRNQSETKCLLGSPWGVLSTQSFRTDLVSPASFPDPRWLSRWGHTAHPHPPPAPANHCPRAGAVPTPGPCCLFLLFSWAVWAQKLPARLTGMKGVSAYGTPCTPSPPFQIPGLLLSPPPRKPEALPPSQHQLENFHLCIFPISQHG